MNYLHFDQTAGPDDDLIVTLDHQANVLLMDDMNFNNYRAGRSFRYHGGWYEQSPVHLRPPHHGHWHVVVDLGGHKGTVQASVHVA